ncbi:hypothetical protein [uncultured Flavobacterium sp.]|uniref:hypothetical protein n=1 Tax=uncultured Flavobacterium sp. TaxID=165435 RepID=UPI0025E2477D|nr:hypothetical protein [uncultured Flavobacterium sp.]
MQHDKKTADGTTSADDKVDNNAHYSESGKITRDDERDRNNSADDWNAEDSRTGRNK